MFGAPLRLLGALRFNVPAALLSATATSTVVFIATPFLIHPLAQQWGVSPGRVGVVSTLQLLGFVMASWLTPYWLAPRRSVLVAAIAIGVFSNLASAVAPGLWPLAVTRIGAGIALGLIAWVSWAEVFGDDERVGDVAVVGPLVGVVAAPAIAALISVTSAQWLFVALAVLSAVPAPFVNRMHLTVGARRSQERHRPTRSAAAILIALTMFTAGGSSIFIFASDIGQRFDGLSAVATALAYSLNALLSIPAARYRGRRILPGGWMLGTAACALALGTIRSPGVLFISIGLWGFLFWNAVPGAFSMLARRSRYPDERAGDAQAVMAAGRVIGPTIGGAFYIGGPFRLGLVASAIMVAAAATMLYVEGRVEPVPMRRRTRSEPDASTNSNAPDSSAGT